MIERPVIVRATGLSKTFVRGSEEVHAVLDASFEIFANELTALVGPSGSGKTTILNLLAGWETPDAGTVHLAGWAGPLETAAWDRIALVPQTLGLLGELSIRENVALASRLGTLPGVEDDRIDDVLEDLGLAQLADRSPDEISLGEQQRAALARALVSRPSLLLTDEPSGHQDALWARGVFGALRKICSEGTACVVATHNEEVLGFVDRILEMRDGQILASEGIRQEHHGPT
ncbi:MAG: ATP-binding cassette domain-containing protein [Actinomycetota bacterium]|nr:ATP-binding cassette domain-containing protein [Actinomycetota bacterium]